MSENPLTFGSLFSGIGGFDLGFEQAGMQCAWQVEIDTAARSVLAKHWPGVPRYEDVRDVRRDNATAVDLICGGFPCQDVSVAGKREGLAGERSGLWFEFHRIVDELRPKWVVVENVPGLLSSNRGADFAVIVRGLVECGYGVTWRILDAQYFGVAQRRRRVFIVGSLGDGRSAEVLFEREGLFGHPPARRAQGQGVAGTVSGSPPSRRNGGSSPTAGHFVSAPLGAHHRRDDLDNDTYVVEEPLSFDWQTAGSERTYIHDRPGATRSLSASKTLAVAYGGNNTSGEITVAPAFNAGVTQRQDFASEALIFEPRFSRNGRKAPDTIAPPLKAQNGGTGKGDGQTNVVVAFQSSQSSVRQVEQHATLDGNNGSRRQNGVRRLTPVEASRLQGFPDTWNAYGMTPNGELVPQSDSARYRQLGNAVAVPVARWIGQRIVRIHHA